MENDTQIVYHRCYTCGRRYPSLGAYAGKYCSRECARIYRRCPVCGDYFEQSDAAPDDFCSAECAGIDAGDRPEELVEILEEAEILGDEKHSTEQ